MKKNSINYQKIGQRLREIRKNLNKTIRDMSKISDTSLGGISDMEKGKIKPSFTYFYALVEKFNVNINWILTGKGTMFPPDIELNLDFGKDNEIIKEMILCLEHNDFARIEILRDFLHFKTKHPQIIENVREMFDKDDPGKEQS